MSTKISVLCFNFLENFPFSLLFRQNLELWLCNFFFSEASCVSWNSYIAVFPFLILLVSSPILLVSDKSCIILHPYWESISWNKSLSKHRKVLGLSWTYLCYSPRLKMPGEHWQGRTLSVAAREVLEGFWDL